MADEIEKKSESGSPPTDGLKSAEKNLLETGTPAGVVPPEIAEILRSAGVDLNDLRVGGSLEATMMMYGGPIPPPRMLAEYDAAIPGLGKKIIEWTEEQREHRQRLESTRTEGSERRMDRAQRFTFGTAILGLILASIVGIWGNPYTAGIIAAVAVGGPAAAVAFARLSAKSASKKKDAKTKSR